MLNEVCYKISEVIHGVLAAHTEVKDGAICHPTENYSSIYRLQCGLLGIVVGDNLPEDSLFKYIIDDCEEFEKQAIESFEGWLFTSSRVWEMDSSVAARLGPQHWSRTDADRLLQLYTLDF